MLPVRQPYKIQVFVTDAVREAVKEAAHLEQKSLQELFRGWLAEKLRAYPKGAQLLANKEI